MSKLSLRPDDLSQGVFFVMIAIGVIILLGVFVLGPIDYFFIK